MREAKAQKGLECQIWMEHGKVWDYVFLKTFLVKIYVAIAIVYYPFPPPLFF